MRIAQIAPVIESVPPKKYGGSERVVYELTEELVKRGHEVTLFASGDSQTSAELVSPVPKSLRSVGIDCRADGTSALTMLNIGLAYQMQQEFDIIHDHTHVIGLPTANLATTPVVVTLHDPVFDNYKPLLETLTNPGIVTISHAQSAPAPNMNNIGIVYNGLSMGHYPFSASHKGYLLFFGTFRPEKGAHTAILVAKRLKMPLIMAGKLDDWQRPYFKAQIKPHLSKVIRYIGEVTEKERNELMRHAVCLLHPIEWLEPFGLALIEAMACGCPVIAFDRGSSREIIKEGISGFVVKTVQHMIAAVKQIDSIDRLACRQYVLAHFNAQRMTDGYEAIYRRLLAQKIKQVKLPEMTSRTQIEPMRNFVFSPDFS